MTQRRRILDIHNRDRYISFKDSHVLSALVSNHVDTTGNGLIDVWEASAVTTLSNIFSGNELTEFPELKYFTGLTELGDSAFSSSSIQTIDLTMLPSAVTKISDSAFRTCTSLTKIVLPSTITEFEESAFSYSGIAGVEIDINLENVTTIGNYSFTMRGKPKGLTTLWSNLKYIGQGAFQSNSWIETLNIDSSMTVDMSAFASSSALTTVVWDTPSVQMCGTMFRYCEALVSADVNALRIADSAFYGCKALTSVTLGTDIESIASYTFNGCTACTEITYKGTKSQWNAITLYSNWKSTTMTTVHCTDGDITLS